MINIIFLIICVLILFLLVRSENRSEKAIFKKGKASIGTVIRLAKTTHYFGGGGYDYYFYNDNHKKSYSSFYKLGLLTEEQKKNIKKGDKFLVLYLPGKGSIILFDKPIKDSTDFKRYVKEFEDMRKRNKKD